MFVVIELDGVRLTVSGDYNESEPATMNDPGEPESFGAVDVLTISGDSILGLLEDRIEQVECLALATLRDSWRGEEAENEAWRRGLI